MRITQVKTGKNHEIVIERVKDADYKTMTKARYFFNWKTEKKNWVYKLRLNNEEHILGLMSIVNMEEEQRFEIKLIAVSKENRGKHRVYDGIIGNLITFACREVIRLYHFEGAVSLVPKTKLKAHYQKKYGMLDTGWHLLLQGRALTKLIHKYGSL